MALDERRNCARFSRPKCAGVSRDGNRLAQLRKRELRFAAITIHVTMKEVFAFADPAPKRQRAPTTSAVGQEMRGVDGAGWKLQAAEFPNAGAGAIDLLLEEQHAGVFEGAMVKQRVGGCK